MVVDDHRRAILASMDMSRHPCDEAEVWRSKVYGEPMVRTDEREDRLDSFWLPVVRPVQVVHAGSLSARVSRR